ncbi:MAG: endonuclease V [Planctomycetes bacterium]|nr:endonuclease V [Planctomycetota bacterium]
MNRHRWDISPAEAIALQKELAGQVIVRPLAGPVRTVAGADCGLCAGGTKIRAAAVLCDAESMVVLATAKVEMPCRFPYVPGLLSFREAPAVIAAVEKLPARPDLLMCDAQGLAHPRGFGLASHVGWWLNLPTIGAAKSRLCGLHGSLGRRKGDRADLMLDDKCIGAVLRTRDNVKPMFISAGHLVSLDDAIEWTLKCCRGVRMPQPTRIADKIVKEP